MRQPLQGPASNCMTSFCSKVRGPKGRSILFLGQRKSRGEPGRDTTRAVYVTLISYTSHFSWARRLPFIQCYPRRSPPPACAPSVKDHHVNDQRLTSLTTFSAGCPGPPMGSPPKRWNCLTNTSSSERTGTPVWLFWETEPWG